MKQALKNDNKDTERKKHKPTLMQIEFSILQKITLTITSDNLNAVLIRQSIP